VSNYLAIATATAGLMEIIAKGLKVGGATVQAIKPSAPPGNQPNPGVAVFLYQVTPNLAYRNTDLPTRNSVGEVVQRPRVALDLHYLLTFHGDDGTLEPQRLLGCTVVNLHSQPLLSRSLIHKIISSLVPLDPLASLAPSDLEYEVELVKFTPLPLSLEEMSKLWSVFFQTAYSLSVAYLATVVLIESDQPTQPPLPVRERRLVVTTFRQPIIESVEPQMLNPGDRLTIKGQNLKSENLKVVFNGSQEIGPPLPQVRDREIAIDVPGDLRIGVNLVKIVHEVRFAPPPDPLHQGFASNMGVFIVRPVIVATAFIQGSTEINGVSYRTGTMRLDFTTPVARRQQVVLLLNLYNPPQDVVAPAYTFPAPVANGITDPDIQETFSITFQFQNVVAGTYLVRVRVDEAESELQVDPGTGIYASPQEQI
jgi:hypothetical protein